jgi:hypothetical protein
MKAERKQSVKNVNLPPTTKIVITKSFLAVGIRFYEKGYILQQV